MQLEPRDIDDGEDVDERKLGVFPNPPLEECPVLLLGFDGAKVIFAMPEGEIREEASAKISQLIKVDIFNCQAGQAFLTYWRDSDDKFARDLATTWFIRNCRTAGKWDRSRPQRGLGVWPGAPGEVVLHRGHEVWVYPRDTGFGAPAGEIEVRSVFEMLRAGRGPIYRLLASAPAPSDAALGPSGVWVREQLDLWRFEAIGDDGLTGADLLFGWIMLALLGGVAPFRPHFLIYGMPGSGKTTLMIFVHALLSALAGDLMDSFSPAGFRNDLAGQARPLVLDEAEGSSNSNGPGMIEQALETLRRMTTGDGGMRKQGDIGGATVSQTAVGAVIMGAVNPVKLGPADATRFAEVRMLPLTTPSASGRIATDAEVKAAIAAAKDLAPALLGRALSGVGRYLADVTLIKAALIKTGSDPRGADLPAALAAGRRLMLYDAPLDEGGATEEAEFWRGMMAQREGASLVQNPGEQCLAHLFSWPSGQHSHDRVLSIGQLVQRCGRARINGGEASDYDETLAEHGVKVLGVPAANGEREPWLLVANHHPMLDRVFERTAWRDWRRTLSYLDALGEAFAPRPSRNSERFGMTKQRATCIPLAPWLEQNRSVRSGERSGEGFDD